jgi:hypothetical protein
VTARRSPEDVASRLDPAAPRRRSKVRLLAGIVLPVLVLLGALTVIFAPGERSSFELATAGVLGTVAIVSMLLEVRTP